MFTYISLFFYRDFYGISDDFPYMRMACRPVSGLKQNFVLVTDTIKKVVENNQSLYSVSSHVNE